MYLGHNVTLDGSLNDWISTDRIDNNSVAGYQVYSTVNNGDFVLALSAPVAIGAGTTIWLNTDGKASTGYQVFGSTIGAEYNVSVDANGQLSLYAGGGATQTLVQANLQEAWSADRKVVEFRLPASLVGSPQVMYTAYAFNNQTYLPTNYFSGQEFAVFNQSTAPSASMQRVGIVYSATTAANYFSTTAYSQLFMSAQEQAHQAGVAYDILTESDLTNLTRLSQYKALVFPDFRNVQASQVESISHTLEAASKLYGVSLIAAGEFMTNDARNQALTGDPYLQMKTLFDATRVTGGTGNVTITATDPNHTVLTGYTNGQLVNSYTGVGWNAFASDGGTGQQIATETINGTTSYAAALATQTGARNVLFASDGVMADANMLQKAIDYAVNGTAMSVGLHLSRDAGIVAARVDMDQSQETADVSPDNGQPGIYDKLLPILTQWKDQYDFVGSFFVNIGNNPPDQTTNWSVSLPYYKAIAALGSEIGNHSYTHPDNSNTLSASQLQFQFGQSTTLLNQKLAIVGVGPIQGIAVPGAPETLATSNAILPYAATDLAGLQDFQDISITIANVNGISLTASKSGSVLTGTEEADVLKGGAGIDTINGMGGNDLVTGRGNADILTGGMGTDRFIYNAVGDSAPLVTDTITDFQEGVDKIDLSAIDAIASMRGNQAFTFIGGASFSAAGQLHVYSDGTNSFVAGNTDNNPLTTEFAIKLLGVHTPTATDFVL